MSLLQDTGRVNFHRLRSHRGIPVKKLRLKRPSIKLSGDQPVSRNSTIEPVETAERSRLDAARDAGDPLEALGAVPERAPVGNRQGRLQRERRRLELLQPRSGPISRLSLGRRRHRRHQRREAASVFCRRSLERQGRDPQGENVWLDEQRGQSWRGCEGILLLSRFYTHTFVYEVALQISSGRVSVPRPRRNQRAARSRGHGI